LVAGTEVTLADGTSEKIENLRRGAVVEIPEGEDAVVLDVIAGPEKDPVYVITTDKGVTVKATKTHAFMTKNDLILTSSELKPGMLLQDIDSGMQRVVSIKQENYRGLVYNVILSAPQVFEQADKTRTYSFKGTKLQWEEVLRRTSPFLGLSEKQHFYSANGLLSGDVLIQNGISN
jgi:hypothetical protein